MVEDNWDVLPKMIMARGTGASILLEVLFLKLSFL